MSDAVSDAQSGVAKDAAAPPIAQPTSGQPTSGRPTAPQPTAPSPHAEKPRLTIVVTNDTFAPEVNGNATFAGTLAAGLASRGHDVHVAVPAYDNRKLGPQRETHFGEEFTVHRIYSWRWYPHPWLRFALPWRIKQNAAKILDRVKPDAIHFNSHIITGRGFSVEGQKRGIRIIGTNHFMPENLADYTAIIPPFFMAKAFKMAWDAADRTFVRAERMTTPTRKAAQYLEANTSIDGVLAISCGLHIDRYRPSLEPKTGNEIVFLGRVVEEKRIDVLIRAVAQLDPALGAHLTILGGGDQLERMKQLATRLGVNDRIRFAGFVDDEQKLAALGSAKVFAMPSIAELQSISTMEAMASALPVVAADAMALPHLVHDGENGFLYEPGNVDELAEKLTRVLTMPRDEYLAMQRESLSIVQGHDIERTLDVFETLYRAETVDESMVVRSHPVVD